MSSGHVRCRLATNAEERLKSQIEDFRARGQPTGAHPGQKPRFPTCCGPICVRRGVAGGSRIEFFPLGIRNLSEVAEPRGNQWRARTESFSVAGLIVRIHLPSAGSLRTIGSAGITGLPPGLDRRDVVKGSRRLLRCRQRLLKAASACVAWESSTSRLSINAEDTDPCQIAGAIAGRPIASTAMPGPAV